MSGIDQARRAVRIHTALPENSLALSTLSGTEQLSELFSYRVDCVSENASLDLYDVLGMPIGIEYQTNGDGVRYMHGLVSEAAHVGNLGIYAHYQLTMTAWPWMLTRTSDCRIFSEMSVPDIIESVLSDNGFDDFDNRLMASYDDWNYCVQYKETDFDFISRLMEHEGIYYYFEHFEDRHVMVFCDGSTAHNTAPEYAEIPHYPESTEQSRETDHLVNWQLKKKIRSGKYVTKDFAFDQPKRDLLVKNKGAATGQYDAKEIYDFPGGYAYQESGEMTRAYGEHLAKARMEALSAPHEVSQCDGNVRGLNAGNIFTLINCERDDQNREYLVLFASLHIQMDSYYSGDGGASVELHSSFRCMPSTVPYRPQRKTPKPEIRGPQTAIVVGAAGEEIWTDQHGRVKLQFHWDRYGESDENSSCWVRVSQAWAGEKWGSIHVPRMGQEVIVEYIDGDPDRPIVTGRVYNGDRPVPYDLPANATQSGIKSRSSKGGTPANFNEIRMEDKKGSEELYVHAEKDQNNIVENDETTSVGHDRTESVGNDETISIENNRAEDVGNDETIAIGNDRSETVGNNETIKIVNDRSENVGANETIEIGSNRTVSIGLNKSETVKVNKAESIGIAKQLSIGGTYTVTVGAAVTETYSSSQTTKVSKDNTESIGANQSISVKGDQSFTVSKNQNVSVEKNQTTKVTEDQTISIGKNLVIDAGDQITLKTGKASITMKSDGTIVIAGQDISLDGKGAINQKAKNNIVMKGKKILQN